LSSTAFRIYCDGVSLHSSLGYRVSFGEQPAAMIVAVMQKITADFIIINLFGFLLL